MFQLSETHEQIRQLARTFADTELKPLAAHHDREHLYPAAQIKKLAELGLMGVAIPEADGGAGLDAWAMA